MNAEVFINEVLMSSQGVLAVHVAEHILLESLYYFVYQTAV